ncbi:MAG TPA: peptidase S10 [Thermoanaerobaculia bacterium]|nr:peptidase S10 [Thermoanaerobaculia bacterium]
MLKRTALPALALLLALLPLSAPADDKPVGGEKKAEEKEKPAPVEKVSTTRHSITLDGQKIGYTATAGTLLLKDDEGKAKASVFFIAYTRDGVKDPGERPVTFAFNGGPGSASLWVHMGAFGPKIVERDEQGMGLPPPGRLIDNEFSLLDATDLVFIDPVSTGYSRAVPGEDPKQFHGVKSDVESVGEFIRLWVTRNERWASPKFVAGESYGTTRAAGLALYLNERYGMFLNGVVLVSSVLNWQNQEFHVGNDMPYILILPTYTATAWYHKKLPPELASDLRRTLDEVESFALNEYSQALMQGDRLTPEKRHEIAVRLARYTGLSAGYVERSNLRIELERFTKELLRGEGKTVGRLDTRFTGSDRDDAGEEPEYDPASASLDGPYAAAVNDYLRRELGYKEDLVYERSARVWPWSFAEFQNQYVNVAEHLRQAMTKNPDLRVLVASGHFDLATPYFDAVYTVDHMLLPAALRGHVQISQYEAGHMMYVRRSEHQKLKRDVVEFLRAATKGAKK